MLLLDEPLSALDAKIRVSLREEIRAIQRDLGITTIFVTHDQEEALSISDRIVVLNAGKVEQFGTPFEVYNKPATRFVASFVGTLNTLKGTRRGRGRRIVAIDGQLVTIPALPADRQQRRGDFPDDAPGSGVARQWSGPRHRARWQGHRGQLPRLGHPPQGQAWARTPSTSTPSTISARRHPPTMQSVRVTLAGSDVLVLDA